MRLPDWGKTIVGSRLATRSNAAGKLPGLALVSASINIDLGLAQVCGNAVSSAEDSPSGEFANSLG